MSTLNILELRKHDLRVQLTKCVQANGKTAPTTQRVYKKILELERGKNYLLRRT